MLEKSRGVGGRCATRRIDGQPVDHGVCFYHGSDPAFLAALDEVEGQHVEGWPRRVRGQGQPCQPRAFDPRERRLAFADGVNVFAKHLAGGLDVRREARVEHLQPDGGTIVVRAADGETRRAPTVILALPAPQSLALLEPLATASDEIRAVAHLLGATGSVRCLTLIAGYPDDVDAPQWDIGYPEESRTLQLISHDSSKRRGRPRTVLVFQGLPTWSRQSWDEPDENWTSRILEEGARVLGSWALRPEWTQPHRWRYGRASGSAELTAPLLVELPGGARIGLAGEIFAPGGGVQAAWRSGVALATRWVESQR